LIVLSAAAFEDAVRDHFQNAMGHLDEKKPAAISTRRDRRAVMRAIVPAPVPDEVRVGCPSSRAETLLWSGRARHLPAAASAADFGMRARRSAGPAIPNRRNKGRRLAAVASKRPRAFRDQPQRRSLGTQARRLGIGENHRHPA
jgi:hypothetical protein